MEAAVPDVADLRMASLVKQDVRQLQISINNSLRVEELHPKDNTDNNNRLPSIVNFGRVLPSDPPAADSVQICAGD
jgi:hypothetical protein